MPYNPGLDYCNTLYVGLNQSSVLHRQLEENAAAAEWTHASLHGLPVHFRINFKILMFFEGD